MKLNEDRGSLVGGLVVSESDEVIAIKVSGQIIRSAVSEVPVKGRDRIPHPSLQPLSRRQLSQRPG